jgi:hypothetical protein
MIIEILQVQDIKTTFKEMFDNMSNRENQSQPTPRMEKGVQEGLVRPLDDYIIIL